MKALYDSVVRHLDEEAVVEMARGALRIASLSGEEGDAAEFFAANMREVGLESELQNVPESETMGPSVNAIGRLKGTGGGPTLLFNGHIDHNPVCDGWTRDPFGGIIEDGWLYGFVHMKAANATYVMAADAVRKSGIELKGDVVIAHVCGELRGGVGTRHAIERGLTADCFVLGEPTELEYAMAHTASLVLDIHVLGRMKHFATVDVNGLKGVNAVEKMSRVIAALGPSHTPLQSISEGGWLTFEPRRGFEGLPQLNVGPIKGGISREYNDTRPALFPDFCSLTVDFRIVPGMSKASIREDLTGLLDGIGDPDLQYEITFRPDTFPVPFDAPRDSEVVKSILAAHRYVHDIDPTESRVLKFAASDASAMSEAGIPGIIYGPSGKYLSRPDERCETAQLVNAAKAYACVIADICTRKKVD